MTKRKNKEREIFDKLYTYNIYQDCIFCCQINYLHILISVLKNHIEAYHQISESTNLMIAQADNS